MNERWFLVKGDSEFGPFSLSELSTFANDGRLRANDLIRHSEASQAVEARTIKDKLMTAGSLGIATENSPVIAESNGQASKPLPTRMSSQQSDLEVLDSTACDAALPSTNSESAGENLVAPARKAFGMAKKALGSLWAFVAYYKCPSCNQRTGKVVNEWVRDHRQEVRSCLENNVRVQRVFDVYVIQKEVNCQSCSHSWYELAQDSSKA